MYAGIVERGDLMKRNLRYRTGPSTGTMVGADTDTFYAHKELQRGVKTWDHAHKLYEMSHDPSGLYPKGGAFLTEEIESMLADGFLAPGTKLIKKNKVGGIWKVHDYYFVVYRNPEVWWAWHKAGYPGELGPDGAGLHRAPRGRNHERRMETIARGQKCRVGSLSQV